MGRATPKFKVKGSIFSRQELCALIKKNYTSFLNNHQFAAFLGIKLSTLRSLCYSMGLKRMELEYFTKQQEKYLIKHYRTRGDIELAEIFQQKWPKKKGWTKKHIEKKRSYLNLQRTSAQIKAIHKRNVKKGRFAICPVKAWNRRGRAPEGEVRYWTSRQTGKKYPVIKHNGSFVQWGRWAWQSTFGDIPEDMNVIFKDGDPFHLSVDNLALISNQELAGLNNQKSSQGLSDNYIAGILTHGEPELRKLIKQHVHLLEAKRKQLILNRTIYEQRTSKNA